MADQNTSIWPIEVADQHPQAEIIATDLSPIQPKWAPTNLSFQVDDIETEWTFGKPFDFIHIRILGGSIADWPKLIANAHANLTPGGYLEVVEWETWSFTDDGSLPEDSKFDHWQKELNKAASSFGREMRIATKVKGWVEEAGFEDVNQEVWKVRHNSSPFLRLMCIGMLTTANIDPSLPLGQRPKAQESRRHHAGDLQPESGSVFTGAVYTGARLYAGGG